MEFSLANLDKIKNANGDSCHPLGCIGNFNNKLNYLKI